MKQLNVFIFPTDDRSGQVAMIYHYARLGHKVFLPKHKTLGLNWPRIATWPMLLCKSSSEPSKRNIEIHGFNRFNDQLFGEDYFLTQQKFDSLYHSDISCEIIDLEKDTPHIDIYHTLRGAENYLDHYQQIAIKLMPNAKWVSSTFNMWTSNPGNKNPRNVAKFVPANYQNAYNNVNNVNIFCSDFELELLGTKLSAIRHNDFASFNHNFHVRQPEDYAIFSKMNDFLLKSGKKEVKNYGGNVRAVGADIRFSEEKGVTGNWTTISPKEAIELISSLKAIVHFKQNDWGGGVFYNAVNTSTPIITTNRYVAASNSSGYLINGFNSIFVDTPEEASKALLSVLEDDTLAQKLCHGMKEIKERIFNQNYWNNWEKFVKNVIDE